MTAPATCSSTAVCTIFEGHYHFGAAALVNSLIANGFTGRIWMGTRGPLPPWLSCLEKISENRYRAGSAVLCFEKLEVRTTMSAEKPRFMHRILQDLDPDAGGIAYFDADIVADTDWNFFESWMGQGIALCEDNCFGSMSENHLLRSYWRKFALEIFSTHEIQPRNQYFNAGFVGISRSCLTFLKLWCTATDRLPRGESGDVVLKVGRRHNPFNCLEQDTLNIAVMVSPLPITTLGYEGMGFSPGMDVMWHAVDNPKPWQRNYTTHLLRTGHRISPSQRKYWKYANGAISPWTAWQLGWHRLELRLAAAISRFYHGA